MNINIEKEFDETQTGLEKKISSAIIEEIQFSEGQIIECTKQLCEGLSYIHDQNVLNRGLKPENIVVTPNNQLKIDNFGISWLIELTEQLLASPISDIFYMSPEVCKGEQYSQKSNMWDLGCVIF